MVFTGIDIGTSGVKIVFTDENDQVHASATRPLAVSRPQLHWSEQHPDLWWEAVVECLDELAAEHPRAMARCAGIGLSGQMLGPVLIDRDNRPVRNCILWNDGRAVDECEILLAAIPDIGLRVGCNPNPGFVAPKLMWLARHEPHILDQTDCVLLPKDYVRLKLTGERATEPTDAGGTHLMDVVSSRWEDDLANAANITADRLPSVRSSHEAAGELTASLARRWGMRSEIPVAAGAGDNMAGAVGVGVGEPGDVAISIGTSGVICAVDGNFQPIPDKAVITHRHAVPRTYLSMGVALAATACLDWAAGLLGVSPAELAGLAADIDDPVRIANAPVFLPYLSGIRTPHDRPQARGLLAGLDLETDAAQVAWAVLEGVAFHVRDSIDVQRAAGVPIESVQFIGGGSRSRIWGEMIATLTGLTLNLPAGREVGASLGAARLAMTAAGFAAPNVLLCRKPPSDGVIEPSAGLQPLLDERWARFQQLISGTVDLL